MVNQQRFVDDYYGGSPIVNEAKLEWSGFPSVPQGKEYAINQ